MGFLDRLKPKPREEANPWETQTPAPAPTTSNPWKQTATAPTLPRPADVCRTPARIGKNWALHKLAFAVILLNVGLCIFFTSNNQQFNAALYVYLGVSSILLSHYWGMTREA